LLRLLPSHFHLALPTALGLLQISPLPLEPLRLFRPAPLQRFLPRMQFSLAGGFLAFLPPSVRFSPQAVAFPVASFGRVICEPGGFDGFLVSLTERLPVFSQLLLSGAVLQAKLGLCIVLLLGFLFQSAAVLFPLFLAFLLCFFLALIVL
jgi:hypothetical protein